MSAQAGEEASVGRKDPLSLPGLRDRLEEACARIHVPEFVKDDPVQFPRRFSSQPDIELTALLTTVISWGRRPQILKDCEKILSLADNRPYEWLMSGQWRELPDDLNIHRTCFARHLKYLLAALQQIYSAHPSLEAFALHCGANRAEAPAWALMEAVSRIARDCNGGRFCPEVIPSSLDTTALKRYNMALRWLVRDDGIVDLGLWSALKPSQLFIPLDVHVAGTSRALGLLSRKSNDRKAVTELTDALRLFDAEDPVRFDFALFGLGIEAANSK